MARVSRHAGRQLLSPAGRSTDLGWTRDQWCGWPRISNLGSRFLRVLGWRVARVFNPGFSIRSGSMARAVYLSLSYCASVQTRYLVRARETSLRRYVIVLTQNVGRVPDHCRKHLSSFANVSADEARWFDDHAFAASSGQFRAPALEGRWHVATGVSPWKRVVESPPAPEGRRMNAALRWDRHRDAIPFRLAKPPSPLPGLVCFLCLGSTGSRPWLSAQVPTGPRNDHYIGSRSDQGGDFK